MYCIYKRGYRYFVSYVFLRKKNLKVRIFIWMIYKRILVDKEVGF